MHVIECSGLTKTFGRVRALNDLFFSLEANRITGLIGPNGAGKTTLLKIAAGFIRGTSGRIRVFSEDPFNSLKVSSNLIFIDDNIKLPASLPLANILQSAAAFYENWNMEIARGLFNYFSLDPGQRYQNLSKGMKSTFNMILGLSARCLLTIFDEPTTGMDAGVRKDFYRALLRDYLQHPRTIILSSHLLNELEDILEDILLLREGEKRLHLPVSELKEFAVALRGRQETVLEMTAGQEIFHRQKFGKDHCHVVIGRSSAGPVLQRARAEGVEILPVKTDDLCVFLTGRNKGGIDHVFDTE